jgi:predicted Zn-dependent protease
MTLAGNTPPQQALSAFLQQQGVKAGGTSTNAINGNPAALGQFIAQNSDGTSLAGYVAFIQHEGITFRLLALTPAANIQTYDAVFRTSLGSFERVTDPRLLNVKPQRLRIVRLPGAMTLTQFNQQYPSVIPMAQLAVINAVEPTQVIAAGTLVKRVVAE